MKTPYLDTEIELLEGFKDKKVASFYQLRKLVEYREIKQLLIHSVVVNEANPNSKEHQAKLLRAIMQGDEELGLYSEVKYCECLAPIVRTGSDNGYCANCGNDLR